MAIFVKFWLFYDARSPNMVKSLFKMFPILHLISGKVTKFLVEKPTSEVTSKKPHRGGKHSPQACRVN